MVLGNILLNGFSNCLLQIIHNTCAIINISIITVIDRLWAHTYIISIDLLKQYILLSISYRHLKKEKIDLIFIYGESSECLKQAAWQVYSNLIEKFRETENV